LKKACLVEFWGSDIRIPEIASTDNPYRARMYQLHPDLAKNGYRNSLKTQKRFARYGFECLIPGYELLPYIQKDIFPSVFQTKARIIVSEYIPHYPDPERLPVVMHAPSHKAKKGTEIIVRTVKKLMDKYKFDFRLINGVEHSRLIELLRDSDILIDELTSGEYGLAAIEAMALGKPTINYIKPAIKCLLPEDLPIVSATIETLPEVLDNLLTDGHKRREIGIKSRAYVEKYHDAHKIAVQLVGIYEELLARTK